MADVILLCAEADRPALHGVTGGLTRAGFTAEVWSGLEVDAAQLATRMEARANPGLYALCAGPRMELAGPALVQAFEARKREDDTLIRVKHWRESPDAAVSTIVRAATGGPTAARPPESMPPSRFDLEREPRHERAQTFSRQQVPDAVVQRLANDHAARGAASGPAPLPSASAAEGASRTPLVVGGIALALVVVAVVVALL